jgi:hypothetical protein
LKCPPEIWPTAKIIAITVKPSDSATPVIPEIGNENRAAPKIDATKANVPMNSAASGLVRIVSPIVALWLPADSGDCNWADLVEARRGHPTQEHSTFWIYLKRRELTGQ